MDCSPLFQLGPNDNHVSFLRQCHQNTPFYEVLEQFSSIMQCNIFPSTSHQSTGVRQSSHVNPNQQSSKFSHLSNNSRRQTGNLFVDALQSVFHQFTYSESSITFYLYTPVYSITFSKYPSEGDDKSWDYRLILSQEAEHLVNRAVMLGLQKTEISTIHNSYSLIGETNMRMILSTLLDTNWEHSELPFIITPKDLPFTHSSPCGCTLLSNTQIETIIDQLSPPSLPSTNATPTFLAKFEGPLLSDSISHIVSLLHQLFEDSFQISLEVDSHFISPI
ncbi:hypothetical protein BLNAU_2186 [Blattamonas nauphoetae]|uniref:Uncharacterized protein n=1 Tax=Blattamonas nauphoetae TaxID=2049346 RepID=A0ABQ9YGC8_9EUKA|nr:hypothetical protein BLNAU_2186 [Blattamonas nauphoetae]